MIETNNSAPVAMSQIEVLNARIALLERRLQLLAEEVSVIATETIAGAIGGEDGHEGVDVQGLSFDADSLSQFAQGFYEREYDKVGQPFRWTGNGPLCELRFFLDRDDNRSFRMAVGATPAAVLNQIAGFVDYAPIDLAIERDGSRRFLTGVIPTRKHTRLAVLTFLLGKAESGEAEGEAGEDQWLGFQFYAISIA